MISKKQELKNRLNNIIMTGSLAAKWASRESSAHKKEYNLLRNYLSLTPREYRKVITFLTDRKAVPEVMMCARDWSNINYNHVPSLAQSRYKKAFLRHDPVGYAAYGQNLVKALSDPELAKTVKINAAAVYPYDVLKGVSYAGLKNKSAVELNIIRAQWAALPNYMDGKNILPIVDVSGSMTSGIPGTNINCLDVSLSLGLYMATKNEGAFHNIFMTFSSDPELITLKGEDIATHIDQLATSSWNMSTDIDKALNKVLSFAIENDIPQSELPEFLVVLSDMEFDRAGKLTAYEKYKKDYAKAGYKAPNIVWWNIQSRQSSATVKYNQEGAGLVSGFSPAIVSSILAGKEITPEAIMMKIIFASRYDLDLVRNVA
jgi:hypothetical protein